MSYTKHRAAHVSAEVERIFDFIHRAHTAQRAANEILKEASAREAGRHGIHPREGGGKRLPKRSARPRTNESEA